MKKESEPSSEGPVFFDKKGNRGKFAGYLGISIALIATIFVIIFVISVLINPFLPQVRLKPIQSLPNSEDTKPQIPALPTLTRHEAAVQQIAFKAKIEKKRRNDLRAQKIADREEMLAARGAPTPQPNLGRPLAVGFYVNWDDSSYVSLKRNINDLDWLVPEWIRLSGDMKDPVILDSSNETRNALDLVHQQKPDMPILPLVQNYKDEKWNPGILASAIATEASRKFLVNSLLNVTNKNHFGGVTIDLEEVPKESQENLFLFMTELHSEFQKHGLIVAQAVPFDNPDWNYKAYESVTDYMMLMAYDQHWATSEPGPIAGQDWFEKALKKRMSTLSPNKTIVCFGNYSYNWTKDEKEAEDITFQQAVLAAKESLDSIRDVKYDPVSKNPYFSYTEEDGKEHTVWFLDSVTAYNQLNFAKDFKPAGFALWRMGSEDPSLWNIFGATKTISTDSLESIKYSYDVDFEGTGEILQVISQPQDGARDLKTDEAGHISEVYTAAPSSYVMQRTGDEPGKIVLTFDDGPDPVWTPKILDILKQENVKAAFFIIGENGQENPELVKRIYAEGHEIGNHSFTHPNLGEVPKQVTELELNATQRLIESLTGHSTRFFRAPYFGDAEPRTPNEVEPTVLAQNLGYITVGLHLDPDDWKLTDDNGTPRTADDIAKATLDAAAITTPEERGQIVLLHDGGGDRALTVEALPKIIHELKARGFEFTTVSDLANISPEQAMPPVSEDQGFWAKADAFVFYSASLGGWLIKWIFLIGIILGLSRVAFIGTLAFIQFIRSRHRDEIHFGEGYEPAVSVIVPAYNEEKVICRTIESLLASDYKNLEIILVDDGSNDKTFDLAKETFAGNDRVRVFRKENAGKAEALNYGWKLAKGEIIVALDADTLFLENTVSELVKRFADEKIGAVAGNAKVGNRINIVTKWQALEYVTSQNFDRRAFSFLNCITVVPGSVGAWRREVLEKTGGFSSDTLAEDQDLTIQVRKSGYKIGYAENAIGLTEAPDTLRGLAKQRFRWSYGTLQCLWKHGDALLRPKYGSLGFIAMPNVWIFQVIFPLISPIMDLMFIWTFISSLVSYLEHGDEYSPTNIGAVMFYYALFLAVDLMGAFFAFMLEKKEQKSLLAWLPIQRFGYRQVIYYVMVKSVLTAIRGTIVGWGKLERKATVNAEM